MIDKENFFDVQNKKGMNYAVGHEIGRFEFLCLSVMRATRLGYSLKKFAEIADFSDMELEIATRFHDGIISILRGETLLREYIHSVLVFGNEHRLEGEKAISEEKLALIAEEQSISVLEYIMNKTVEEIMEYGKSGE